MGVVFFPARACRGRGSGFWGMWAVHGDKRNQRPSANPPTDTSTGEGAHAYRTNARTGHVVSDTDVAATHDRSPVGPVTSCRHRVGSVRESRVHTSVHIAETQPTYVPPAMDSGNTAWVLTSAALILFMTPGLAFFYGGMVRSKNVLGMLMQNVFAMGLISVIWVVHRVLARVRRHELDHRQLRLRVRLRHRAAPTSAAGRHGVLRLPDDVRRHHAGADHRRHRRPPEVQRLRACSSRSGRSWCTSPVAHWVFNANGWIFEMGALDFAGGAAIHINAGIAALVVVAVIGARRGPRQRADAAAQPAAHRARHRASSGSAGSASTPARPSPPTASPPRRSSTRTSRPPPACSAGCSSRRSRPGTPRRSAPAPAPSPASWRSPRAPGSSARSRPSSSASSPASSATWRSASRPTLRLDDSLDVIAVHLVGGLLGTVLLGFFADDEVNPIGVGRLLRRRLGAA